VTVIEVLICCCVPNLIKIGSRVRPPDAHKCWMFNVSLLGNGRCHGNRIMSGMSGTWWDATTQVSFKSFPLFCNMAVVRHLELEFCFSGPPTKSTVWFDYHVKIWFRSNLPRRKMEFVDSRFNPRYNMFICFLL